MDTIARRYKNKPTLPIFNSKWVNNSFVSNYRENYCHEYGDSYVSDIEKKINNLHSLPFDECLKESKKLIEETQTQQNLPKYDSKISLSHQSYQWPPPEYYPPVPKQDGLNDSSNDQHPELPTEQADQPPTTSADHLPELNTQSNETDNDIPENLISDHSNYQNTKPNTFRGSSSTNQSFASTKGLPVMETMDMTFGKTSQCRSRSTRAPFREYFDYDFAPDTLVKYPPQKPTKFSKHYYQYAPAAPCGKEYNSSSDITTRIKKYEETIKKSDNQVTSVNDKKNTIFFADNDNMLNLDSTVQTEPLSVPKHTYMTNYCPFPDSSFKRRGGGFNGMAEPELLRTDNLSYRRSRRLQRDFNTCRTSIEGDRPTRYEYYTDSVRFYNDEPTLPPKKEMPHFKVKTVVTSNDECKKQLQKLLSSKSPLPDLKIPRKDVMRTVHRLSYVDPKHPNNFHL